MQLEGGGSLVGYAQGGLGWAAGDATFIFPDGSRVWCRVTMVLREEDGTWRIVYLHACVGVPDEEVLGLQARWAASSAEGQPCGSTPAGITPYTCRRRRSLHGFGMPCGFVGLADPRGGCRLEGSSSIGRVPVSKTGGWGFKSLLPCAWRHQSRQVPTEGPRHPDRDRDG